MVWMKPGAPHEAMAVLEVPLGPGDALVEIEYATVCGSDLHTMYGRRSAPVPLVLGHEQVGRVVAVAPGAVRADSRPLAVGDRVVWSLAVSCGECDRCLRGITQKCRSLAKYGHEQIRHGWELSGGYATHIHLRAGTTVVAVPEELPAEVAAPLPCATATAVAAIDLATQITEIEGATVLVTGAGLVGLTAIAIANDRGARVIAVDPDPARRQLAERFGARRVVDPEIVGDRPGSLVAALASLAAAEGVQIAVEASGAAGAVAQAIDALDIGGVAVLAGNVHPVGAVPMNPESLVRGLRTVRGLHNYMPRHLVDAVAYLSDRHDAYPFRELVSAEYSLADLDAAVTLAESGSAVRVGVRNRP